MAAKIIHQFFNYILCGCDSKVKVGEELILKLSYKVVVLGYLIRVTVPLAKTDLPV
jgi:hypothetical protein